MKYILAISTVSALALFGASSSFAQPPDPDTQQMALDKQDYKTVLARLKGGDDEEGGQGRGRGRGRGRGGDDGDTSGSGGGGSDEGDTSGSGGGGSDDGDTSGSGGGGGGSDDGDNSGSGGGGSSSGGNADSDEQINKIIAEARAQIDRIEIRDDGIIIYYRNGWVESLGANAYELLDNKHRRVIRRRSTPNDIRRFDLLLGR